LRRLGKWGIDEVMNSAERLAVYLDRALASLGGDFAGLVYLASLRDAYSGRYVHEGLATVAAPEEVHHVLRQRHYAVFTAASAMPLDELCRELEEHFASLGKVPRELARMWLDLEPFREVFPEGSTELQREFFLSQMRAALRVLASSLTMGARLEPAAWPPR
jgi:hypothetical protein